jgi:glucosamine 6-phosphate synthetase-like amidotransferase/phosphosugar isomerase protein
MTKHATDFACGSGAVRTRNPFDSVVRSKTAMERVDGIDGLVPGETRRAVFAQSDWLRRVPTGRRLPEEARVVFTGCGTSFHAAQTGGPAVQALDAVLAPPDADLMVCVSHEGTTALTLEAARVFPGPKWLVTGTTEGPLAEIADEVVVCTPEIERSWCHTASYTCGVAAIDAMHGEAISWLPDAVADVLEAEVTPPRQDKILVAGAGRDWPTAQEAVLKLREGAHISAGAHETEQLLHGHLAAIDETVRAFVLEGEGRAAERARDAVRALETIGCETTLVPSSHPVVDIVQFQLLTLALADAHGIDPDSIRREPGSRWAAAAGKAYEP